jgi:hypothetical protein
VLALAGIAELDVEGDVVAGNLDVAYRAARDEVLGGVRIDQRAQRVLDAGFTEGHA